ncbi:hypothetical protein CMV_009500 [Castanea mollissima]|uniref:Uncharacterized protein n=1 Tax=Castanea mollissima TaxID=60419 RepID=A0A8J4R9R5_9ROSI|nr:hypothetical protein CMV_009500 [Castanea mollissima]
MTALVLLVAVGNSRLPLCGRRKRTSTRSSFQSSPLPVSALIGFSLWSLMILSRILSTFPSIFPSLNFNLLTTRRNFFKGNKSAMSKPPAKAADSMASNAQEFLVSAKARSCVCMTSLVNLGDDTTIAEISPTCRCRRGPCSPASCWRAWCGSDPIKLCKFPISVLTLHVTVLLSHTVAQTLPSRSCALKVPFPFLTNGGGVPESRRAAELSELLGVHILPSQI